MDRDVYIFGAGGFAREVYALLQKQGVTVNGFVANIAPSEDFLPAPYLGDDVFFLLNQPTENAVAFIAIGAPKVRAYVFDKLQSAGVKCPPLIDPTAVVLTKEPLGDATIVYPGVVIMPWCSIGRGVLLNSSATLGHDVILDDFCNINPGANLAGGVKVGRHSLVGIGASIIENITIGAGAVIGAGSTVIRDVIDNDIVYGAPAHKKNT